MDFKQERIATLHQFNVDKKKLIKSVSDSTVVRPASVIMPMLYREINGDSLTNIKKGLNKPVVSLKKSTKEVRKNKYYTVDY